MKFSANLRIILVHMRVLACRGVTSPAQQKHYGIDGDDGNSKQKPCNNHEEIIPRVRHQDIRGHPTSEGEVPINPWGRNRREKKKKEKRGCVKDVLQFDRANLSRGGFQVLISEGPK